MHEMSEFRIDDHFFVVAEVGPPHGSDFLLTQTSCIHKTIIKRLTDDFVKRVFDGEALPLFQHLIDNRELTQDEIDQLRELLDEKSD